MWWDMFLLSLLCINAVETTYIEEEGTFTYIMTAFQEFSGSVLSGVYTSFPVEVDLNQTLYFTISIDTHADLNLRIGIVDIVARDTADITAVGGSEYKIVDNGCTNDDFFNVITVSGETTIEKSFSLSAFEFVNVPDGLAFIHAGVIICGENDTELPTCEVTCDNSKRKRRDNQDLYFVDSGPFVVKKEEDPKDSVDLSSAGVRESSLETLLFLVIFSRLLIFEQF